MSDLVLDVRNCKLKFHISTGLRLVFSFRSIDKEKRGQGWMERRGRKGLTAVIIKTELL